MKNTSEIDKREVRQIRKDLEKLGYSTRRQPGSGNRDIDLQHDVFWKDSPVGALHIEDKYRTECRWKVLLNWKQGAEILTVRSARDERYCFMTWKLFLELIGQNEGRERDSSVDFTSFPHDDESVAPQPVSEVADSAGINKDEWLAERKRPSRSWNEVIQERINAPQSLLTGKTGKPPPKKRGWK